MEKLDRFLSVLMGSFFGVFIGNLVYYYYKYRRFPEIYAARSAPWYYDALPALILFLIAVVVCLIIKRHIRRNRQKTA